SALGLRGILTHQVADAGKDRAAGLTTVVHRYGRARLIGVIKYIIAPVEMLLLILMLVSVSAGVIYFAVLSVYACYELGKICFGWRIALFARDEDRAYVPCLNNAFYEVWGPRAAAPQAPSTHRAPFVR